MVGITSIVVSCALIASSATGGPPGAPAPPPDLNAQAGQELDRLGPFRVGDAGRRGYCIYEVATVSGTCPPPVAIGSRLCLPCEGNVTKESQCRPAGTLVRADFVSEDGRAVECSVGLKSLGGDCVACPEGGIPVNDHGRSGGAFQFNNRQPGRNETFCRYRVIQILPEVDKKPRPCPVKVRDIVCLPCPENRQCHVEGMEVVISVKASPEAEPCGVWLRSLSSDCRPCAGGKILDAAGGFGAVELRTVLATWGEPGGAGDLDGDAVVDIDDLLAVLAGWTGGR